MQLRLSSSRIWIYSQIVDFRKSIDGLHELVHSQSKASLREDVFIFYNRHRDKLKLLAWHGNGFVLLYKRLEKGRFTCSNEKKELGTIDEKQLSWLIAGLDWKKMSEWNSLEYDNFY